MKQQRITEFHIYKAKLSQNKKKMITFLNTNIDDKAFIGEKEDILSGKLYKESDCCNDDKVKYGQFVHLLANTGLPTLWTTTRGWTKAEIRHHAYHNIEKVSEIHARSSSTMCHSYCKRT